MPINIIIGLSHFIHHGQDSGVWFASVEAGLIWFTIWVSTVVMVPSFLERQGQFDHWKTSAIRFCLLSYLYFVVEDAVVKASFALKIKKCSERHKPARWHFTTWSYILVLPPSDSNYSTRCRKTPYPASLTESEKWSWIRIRNPISTKIELLLEVHPLLPPTEFGGDPWTRSWDILRTKTVRTHRHTDTHTDRHTPLTTRPDGLRRAGKNLQPIACRRPAPSQWLLERLLLRCSLCCCTFLWQTNDCGMNFICLLESVTDRPSLSRQ